MTSPTFALTATTGKLSSSILSHILNSSLLPPSSLILCTSTGSPTHPHLSAAVSRGAQVRRADYDDPASLEAAFAGVDRLILVSTPAIALDFNEAPEGQGRERQHYAALEAARKVGVKHVYYTSLAFACGGKSESKAGVMVAHLRTEARLQQLAREGSIQFTSIREGLYSESWPLYFGHWDLGKDNNGRSEVKVAGDGKITWTALSDVALGTALIATDKDSAKWEGCKVTLAASKGGITLAEMAEMVGKRLGREIKFEVVDKEEHVKYYVNQRGMDEPFVRWWIIVIALSFLVSVVTKIALPLFGENNIIAIAHSSSCVLFSSSSSSADDFRYTRLFKVRSRTTLLWTIQESSSS
ncbi:hypothetical protein BDY21DRAFT_361743 [Lineolata rhizophorae]|uniref:NmrA-like domain-containing protein n=1 Tax=Lineolata rhizophorae TaxID=578093 RepID=A0A6A6P8R6_9PEZI|nr:hypothetical protein BDY21DRAFT_361743 [Lineolata rhizophorae]